MDQSPAGFTLVEMLVVIVIIGILSGLITVAAVAARNAVRRGIITAEVSELEAAIGHYKEKCGDYPPNFPDNDDDSGDDMNIINRHLVKAFPRYTNATVVSSGRFGWQNDLAAWFTAFFTRQGASNASQLADILVGAPNSRGPDPRAGGLSGSMALAFWLGGLPDDNFNPTGFSANPSDPFDAQAARNYLSTGTWTPTPSRLGPFFEFDGKRLHCPDGATRPVGAAFVNDPNFLTRFFLRYFPKNANPDGEPYVYFGRRYYRMSGPADNPPNVPSVVTYNNQVRLNRKDCPLMFAGAVRAMVRPYWEQTQFAQIEARGNAAVQTSYLRQVSNADSVWANAKTFQILCPGLDGLYCEPGWSDPNNDPPYGSTFPTGDDYVTTQLDDISNFSGGTLKDKMP